MHYPTMKAYSVDLRERIVAAVRGGMSKAEAARTFGVGATSVKRYVSLAEQGRSLEPGKAPGRESKLGESGMRLLEEDLHESAHKGERIRELIEERGCELLYLPPYSPDLNPIEEAFSKIKGILRQAEARGREALIEVLGAAISAVSPADARGFFEHGGYHLPVHVL